MVLGTSQPVRLAIVDLLSKERKVGEKKRPLLFLFPVLWLSPGTSSPPFGYNGGVGGSIIGFCYSGLERFQVFTDFS